MLYKLIIVVLFLIILYHLYNKKNIEGYENFKCWNGKKPCNSNCNINNLQILECQNEQLEKLYNDYQLLPEIARIANLEARYCILPNNDISCIQEILITKEEIKSSLDIPESPELTYEEKQDQYKQASAISAAVSAAEADHN